MDLNTKVDVLIEDHKLSDQQAQRLQAALGLAIMRRDDQITKWGMQTHPLEIWHLILSEEQGEAAHALMRLRQQLFWPLHGLHDRAVYEELLQAYISEVQDVVASGLALLEAILADANNRQEPGLSTAMPSSPRITPYLYQQQPSLSEAHNHHGEAPSGTTPVDGHHG